MLQALLGFVALGIASVVLAIKFGYHEKVLAKRILNKNAKLDPPFPRILGEYSAGLNFQFRWLRLKKVLYADEAGKVREWEKVERTTRNAGSDADGVMIFARIKGGSRDGCVPFVVQFSPAIGKKTLQLPAGLIDKGETPEQAALRELEEETGLIGKVTWISPVLYLDPGISASGMRFVHVDVDGTLPANEKPCKKLDRSSGEFCEVIYILNPTVAKINDTGKDLGIDASTYLACARH